MSAWLARAFVVKVVFVAVLAMVEAAVVVVVEVAAFAVAAAAEGKELRAKMRVFLVVGMPVVQRIFFVPPHIVAVLVADGDVVAGFFEDAAADAVEDAVVGVAEDVADAVAYVVGNEGGVEDDVGGDAGVQNVRIVVRDFGVDGEFLEADLVYAGEGHENVVADRVSFGGCKVVDSAHMQIDRWSEGHEDAVVPGSFVFVERF